MSSNLLRSLVIIGGMLLSTSSSFMNNIARKVGSFPLRPFFICMAKIRQRLLFVIYEIEDVRKRQGWGSTTIST